ncbi:MAG: gamma-glutamylcyclotransferase [Alcanivoracaceae bacterium]|nr:gamma-glutamylcyclotransferase [Alcanivoracaceae bacterium]
MACEFYFAYGSNMDPARMAARGMRTRTTFAAKLAGWQLQFNKRSADFPGAGFANIVAADSAVVPGVLYQLAHADEIFRMDPYENWPVRYRREIRPVITQCGERIETWVYIANAQWQTDHLLPPRWYLNHLLAGRPWLPNEYYQQLRNSPCLSE